MSRMAELFNGRLLRFLLASFGVYLVAAIATDAPSLILVLNDLVLSAAAGVCVAYSPILIEALAATHPTKGEFLGAGIFLVSLSMLLFRIASVIARDLGHPQIVNTDYVTFSLFVALIGAVLHMWAPNVQDGRLSRDRWVRTGIIVAVGLFISFGCWTLRMSVVHPTMIELR